MYVCVFQFASSADPRSAVFKQHDEHTVGRQPGRSSAAAQDVGGSRPPLNIVTR